MSTVVIYLSKTGYTKRYAEWIAEEVGADLMDAEGIDIEAVSAYDTIIYGGGIYPRGINGTKLLKKIYKKNKDKKLVIFGVGLAPPRPEMQKAAEEADENDPKMYYFRGGFDYDKLDKKDQSIIKAVEKRITKKNDVDVTEFDKELLLAYKKPIDHSDKESIKELVAYVKGEDKTE